MLCSCHLELVFPRMFLIVVFGLLASQSTTWLKNLCLGVRKGMFIFKQNSPPITFLWQSSFMELIMCIKPLSFVDIICGH